MSGTALLRKNTGSSRKRSTGPEKTIVFLTDLHNKEFGDQNCRLLDAVRKVKPDAVLSGGDGMVAKKGNSDVEIPRKLLTELAKEFPGILRKWKP